MRPLVLIHRWLGIAFCLLFAMWFASGLVMHFVPYPALEEGERAAGLTAFDPATITIPPGEALKRFGVHKVRRIRLAAPGGTPAYMAQLSDGSLAALSARDGSLLKVNEAYALASATTHARARGLAHASAYVAALEPHHQWTVANGFDAHRPLYRVALNDAAHTELYVSSITGEVLLDTTRFERAWNWAGSVVHWIYPTVLRQHWATWDSTVWWLSLAATIGALTGLALGVIRFKGLRTPYHGWMKWHHVLGLACSVFVITWIFSGWLSMDHGRLFSRSAVIGDERMRIEGRALSVPDMPGLDTVHHPLREIEWFPFAGQMIMRTIDGAGKRNAWITPAQAAVAARMLGTVCTSSTVEEHAWYPARSTVDGAPVYRITCGEVWFHIDGSDGRALERLDSSRRAYRWLFQALHTFDVPALSARPALRSTFITLLCLAGLAFSITGVVIGWRRLKRTVT